MNNQCPAEELVFGMNSGELMTVSIMGAFLSVVYLFKLMHKYS